MKARQLPDYRIPDRQAVHGICIRASLLLGYRLPRLGRRKVERVESCTHSLRCRHPRNRLVCHRRGVVYVFLNQCKRLKLHAALSAGIDIRDKKRLAVSLRPAMALGGGFSPTRSKGP